MGFPSGRYLPSASLPLRAALRGRGLVLLRADLFATNCGQNDPPDPPPLRGSQISVLMRRLSRGCTGDFGTSGEASCFARSPSAATASQQNASPFAPPGSKRRASTVPGMVGDARSSWTLPCTGGVQPLHGGEKTGWRVCGWPGG